MVCPSITGFGQCRHRFRRCLNFHVPMLLHPHSHVGLLGNLPFVMAPGLGLTAYFTYGLVNRKDRDATAMTWQAGLACFFIAGAAMLVLSVSFLVRAPWPSSRATSSWAPSSASASSSSPSASSPPASSRPASSSCRTSPRPSPSSTLLPSTGGPPSRLPHLPAR